MDKICMYKNQVMCFVACVVISLSFLCMFVNKVYAQLQVELVLDPEPEKNTLHLGLEPKEIWIEARLSERTVKLIWNVDGPGEFKTLEGGIGGIYTIPEQITNVSAKVTITATVTNDRGDTTKNSVTLDLIAPSPNPIPLPTSTPVQVTIHRTLLQHERFYLSPGETVVIFVDITNPSKHHVKVKCAAVKGKVECTVAQEESVEIQYTSPDKPGKEMLEVQIIDSESGEVEHTLIKIEILDI